MPISSTAKMGPMLHKATMPKLFSSACLPLVWAEATPMPKAIMKGTVMGPVVTPPESKATAKNSSGTMNARRKTRM